MKTITHPRRKIIRHADDSGDDPGLAMLAADFTRQTRWRQLELLEAIYSDPGRGVPIAKAEGIDQYLFADDVELFWLAAEVGGHLPRRRLVNLARLALRRNWYWDQSQILGNYGSALWSDATLHHLFGAMFFSPQFIRLAAGRLIEQYGVWTEASIHFRYAISLLEAA
jgi:hypothetical protein